MIKGNLYASLPASDAPEEEFSALFRSPHVRIERIVSQGQRSPEGFWYDQEENEWVLLIEGEAELEFKTPKDSLYLKKGDWILIPAHKKHRINHTSSPAIWLAVRERKNTALTYET